VFQELAFLAAFEGPTYRTTHPAPPTIRHPSAPKSCRPFLVWLNARCMSLSGAANSAFDIRCVGKPPKLAADRGQGAWHCETNAAEPKIAFPLWKLRKLPQRAGKPESEAREKNRQTSPDNWQKFSIKV